MPITHRFGRRLALPSTRQIIHELKMFALEERLLIARAAENSDASDTGAPDSLLVDASKRDTPLAAA
jgi:hypothetical protein